MPPKRKIRGNKRRNYDGQGGQESQPEETTSPATTTTTPAAAAASATPQGLTHHLLLCLSYICLLLINIANNITSLCWSSLLLFSKGSNLCGGIGLAGRKVLCDKIAGSYNTRKWSYNTLWPFVTAKIIVQQTQRSSDARTTSTTLYHRLSNIRTISSTSKNSYDNRKNSVHARFFADRWHDIFRRYNRGNGSYNCYDLSCNEKISRS